VPEHLIHIPVTDSATGQPKQNKKPKEMCMGERKRRRKGVNQKRRDQEGDGKVGREENRTEQKEGYWPGRKEGLVN